MDDLRLHELLDKDLEGRVTDAETDELFRELRSSPRARQCYWEVLEQHVLTGAILSESRGRDLASLEAEEAARAPEPAAPARRPRGWVFSMTVAAAASCLLLALGWWFRLAEPAPLATILDIAGNVEVSDASGRSSAAELGSRLYVGQVLRLGDDGSRVEVLFADGTQMTLQPGSTLRFFFRPT